MSIQGDRSARVERQENKWAKCHPVALHLPDPRHPHPPLSPLPRPHTPRCPSPPRPPPPPRSRTSTSPLVPHAPRPSGTPRCPSRSFSGIRPRSTLSPGRPTAAPTSVPQETTARCERVPDVWMKTQKHISSSALLMTAVPPHPLYFEFLPSSALEVPSTLAVPTLPQALIWDMSALGGGAGSTAAQVWEVSQIQDS